MIATSSVFAPITMSFPYSQINAKSCSFFDLNFSMNEIIDYCCQTDFRDKERKCTTY